MDQVHEMISQVDNAAEYLINILEKGNIAPEDFATILKDFAKALGYLKKIVPEPLYNTCDEIFDNFIIFCSQSTNVEYVKKNVDNLYSSLKLVDDCLKNMDLKYANMSGVCPCCGKKVIFISGENNEIFCSNCKSTQRERLITLLLRKIETEKAPEGTTALVSAKVPNVKRWIEKHCPQVNCDSLSCIADMEMLNEGVYDFAVLTDFNDSNQEKSIDKLKSIIKNSGMVISDENIDNQFETSLFRKDSFETDGFKISGIDDSKTIKIFTKSKNTKYVIGCELKIDRELCNNGPIVTVILSAYNHERYVAQAIESVINQSYKNIEFIVADDGSKDGTADVMRRYNRYFARAEYFKDNKGGRSGYLSKFATGKYIALMHSDDVWDKDKLALEVAEMEKNPKCGACFTWCGYVDDNMNPIEDTIFIQKNRSKEEWLRFFFENENVLCNPSSLIRRELYSGVNYFGCTARQLSDLFKWVNLVQKYEIKIVPRKLITMRRHMSEGLQNTSAAVPENYYRHFTELGIYWLAVLRNMDEEVFKNAFGTLMRNPAAHGEEIKCEKYFLMLGSSKPFIRHSALIYYGEILPSVKDIFEEKYLYFTPDAWKDETEKSLTNCIDWSRFK